MIVRKRMPAALLGAALVAIVVASAAAFQAGNTSTTSTNFGDPFPGLTPDLQALFVAGQANFGSPDTPETGLGPVFNNTPCAACHTAGAIGGASTITETRVGTVTDGVFNPLPQYTGNVTPSLLHTQGIGTFPTLVESRLGPVGTLVDFVGEIVPQPPAVPDGPATIVAGRRTTALFGAGLVDAVPTSTFQAIAAQEQANSPATAGRVNMVSDVFADGQAAQQLAGRFGWKCQHSTLFAFSADAYLNEIGITTPAQPNENPPQDPNRGYRVNHALLAANPGPAVGPALTNDPDNSSLTQFTQFMTLLAPPPPVLPFTFQARQGAHIFNQIGCANCHLPTLRAGPSPIPQINNATFHPFSDFLLHDMGSLGDGIAQAGAGQTEMRTAPLWGVRVLTTFLHDGRATTLSQAILAHAGQGQAAANAFANLDAGAQANLIAFLNSL
jgi:CxxC motif-containing protein (DUF1111 family)